MNRAHASGQRQRPLRHRRALWVIVGALTALSCSRSALKVDDKPLCPASCDDGLFCNGVELCDETLGVCVPPTEPFSCDDGQECTRDRCDEARDRCEHVAQPRDEDGDTFNACDNDCDDNNAQVHPGAIELCNMIDDDCDGSVDEHLISECGDCRPGCQLIEIPDDDIRLPDGESGWIIDDDTSSAVAINPDGALVLTSASSEVYFAWIANNDDGKVTKLDTRDGTQVARYDSALLGPDTQPAPVDMECVSDASGPHQSGNCPSRTAVDHNGAVYVANRAFGRQGTVTKIAGFREDCVDRNGDGMIQTSEDLNLNGRIEPRSDEYLGQRDECLLWTVNVGAADGGIPRALAVASDGTVWVGLHRDQRVVQLDPDDGHALRSFVVPSFKPYGAAFDRRGRLWMTESLTGQILSIDTNTGSIGRVETAPSPQAGCPSSYGIAVDTESRVWLAGFSCPYAFRFDPDARQWLSVHIPGAGITRGIAARDDGKIFIAASHEWIQVDLSASEPIAASDPITRLTVFNAEDGSDMQTIGTPEDPILGRGSIGVGLDSEGRAWLVNKETGTATRVNVDTGDVQRFAVGPDPYTYSDFTGYALRRIAAPSGYVRSIVEGCALGPTEWERISLDALTPNGARVELRMRTAASVAELDSAMWIGPWSSPFDLLTAPGPLHELRYLEVETRLISVNESATPVVRGLTVQIHCPF